jgi:hypothetical protein
MFLLCSPGLLEALFRIYDSKGAMDAQFPIQIGWFFRMDVIDGPSNSQNWQI